MSDVVRRLKLPTGEYVVGRVGYGLSRDRASTAKRAELLVTEKGWRRLKERAWRERGAGTVLTHPRERGLSARVVELDDIRHLMTEVDGVPVVAVDPDPPAPPPTAARQLVGTMAAFALSVVVLGAVVYGVALFFSDSGPATFWQHLTFRTAKVEASVERWAETGTCNGVDPWDESPRISLTLRWTEGGRVHTTSYTGCDADVDSPQDIWVTSDGRVASQHSPWVDHIWPALIVGAVPYAFVFAPFGERLSARWWRRRRI